jgi:C4-dicarboxylate transporter DctQ subunit
MQTLMRFWARLEEAVIAFLLAAMTLVTFFYVVMNNLYTVLYSLGDRWEATSGFFFAMGDSVMSGAQAMTWSSAATRALFAWLIFLGISYGVRTGGHIGIDALVKLTSRGTQKVLGVIACLFCLGYAGLFAEASFEWTETLYSAGIGAEDLGHFGIQQWMIGLVVPVGFALVFIRFVEILVRILRDQQTGLGLADEAADALKLAEHEEVK